MTILQLVDDFGVFKFRGLWRHRTPDLRASVTCDWWRTRKPTGYTNDSVVALREFCVLLSLLTADSNLLTSCNTINIRNKYSSISFGTFQICLFLLPAMLLSSTRASCFSVSEVGSARKLKKKTKNKAARSIRFKMLYVQVAHTT